MEIIIVDYLGTERTVTVDLSKVDSMDIRILSGDEILIVYNKDGTTDYHDSSEDRLTNYFDGQYCIWSDNGEINYLENEKWCNCRDSYDRQCMGA